MAESLNTKNIWTESNLKIFHSLYQRGFSDKAIAGHLSCHKDTISRLRKRLGLARNHERSQAREMRKKKMSRLYWDRVKSEEDRKKQEERDRKVWNTLRYYNHEQDVFFKGILKFRDQHRRPPTFLEAFRLAKEMGWRKEL